MANTKTSKKIFDILDTMSQDVLNKFEEMGYDFLEELGYYIPKRPVSKYRMRILKKQLDEGKRCLVYKGVEDIKEGKILYWWELHKLTKDNKEGDFICRSKGLKVVLVKPEKK